ncbi:hypothetical protein GQ42DRAFT_72616 [Ramicandelaber brevisporus]|nr:hypothetical protein GQ42DRAFT_72616 [Ramicandelaber brevisporus]
MGRHAVLVMGPAGAGKSTLCAALMTHLQTVGRTAHLVNLDPAAEEFEYSPTIDIRDLISLEDAMSELQYGPNGGLIYCYEFLLSNLDWLDSELGDYDEDFLIIDCPGQIELYTHFPYMQRLCSHLTQHHGFRVCGLYLLDAQFLPDPAKYFSGVMTAVSAMVGLNIPFLNLLTKMDIAKRSMNIRDITPYLDPTTALLYDQSVADDDSLGFGVPMRSEKFRNLTEAIAGIVDNQSLVRFLPIDLTKDESLEELVLHVDIATQFDEDREPHEPEDEGPEQQ